MQAFKAKIHLIVLLVLKGCTGGMATAVSLTPLVFHDTDSTKPASPPTPTLVSAQLIPASEPRSLGDPYIPVFGNAGYDVLHYTLRFSLDPAAAFVAARQKYKRQSRKMG